MKKMLNKHILSEYASVFRNDMGDNNRCMNSKTHTQDYSKSNATAITENIETSDLDEFIILGSTQITKSVELSDPDELCVDSDTGLTHAVEISDYDEMYMGPTKNTFTIEITDEDEFLMM